MEHLMTHNTPHSTPYSTPQHTSNTSTTVSSSTPELSSLAYTLTETACYDNGVRFTERARLDMIEAHLAHTPYQRVDAGPLTSMWMHPNFKDTRASGEPTLLVSSHVDSVYQTHWARVDDAQGTLSGTIDNSVTNATLLSLTLAGGLPPNALVLFNGDEERMSRGIAQAIRFLHSQSERFGSIAFTIVLDVTFEWSDDGYTLENYFASSRPTGARHFPNEHALKQLLQETFPHAHYVHHDDAGEDDAWEVDEFDLSCLTLCLPARAHPNSRDPDDFCCPFGQTITLTSLTQHKEALRTLAHCLTQALK